VNQTTPKMKIINDVKISSSNISKGKKKLIIKWSDIKTKSKNQKQSPMNLSDKKMIE